MTSAVDNSTQASAGLRKRSVVTIELANGERRAVNLAEMSAADRELAEKYGYKPVRMRSGQ